MSEVPQEPFEQKNLESPAYRERLMRKLNCLIAVLEVANAKVKKSLAGPEPDIKRLTRIGTNLSSTLDVCRRARRALERREALPDGLPENLAQVVRERGTRHLPKGANVELSSPTERERFEGMGQITSDEVAACDLDELSGLLLEEEA